MKCNDVQHWLLSTPPDGGLSCSVRNHLLRCIDCRRHQQLLKRLDTEVRQLPLPPSNPTAKSQLLARIKNLPQEKAADTAITAAPRTPAHPVETQPVAAAAGQLVREDTNFLVLVRSLHPLLAHLDWRLPALALAAAVLL